MNVEAAVLPRYEADPKRLRRTFSYFPSGVVALLADVDGEPQGMIATAFTVGVSFEPPLVSCAIQNESSTWPRLQTAARVGISVLGSEQERFAKQIASRDRDGRFRDVPLRHVGSDARFIAGAPVWFECTVHGRFPAGDHTVALLEVHALGADPDLPPLIFHAASFRQLLVPERDLRTIP